LTGGTPSEFDCILLKQKTENIAGCCVTEQQTFAKEMKGNISSVLLAN
jgi:hypothetical protein